MFSFGGGAGTNLTGAGAAFSADGFFVAFLADSTSCSGSSSKSFEMDLDTADDHTYTSIKYRVHRSETTKAHQWAAMSLADAVQSITTRKKNTQNKL